MEEIRTKIGDNKLTREEVKANEDFGQLLKKHQQFVKKKNWIVGGLILAGVFLISSLYFYINPIKKKSDINKTLLISENRITPVFGIELDKEKVIVDANTGGVFNYNNTLIDIPKEAFVDSNGNRIEGEVTIFYKEFHNPTDFFISGIPMTYDSAGVEFQFESAGMFDIRGEQNGLPIFIDKSITVKLVSQQEGDYFNKYYYNEETNTWEFISNDVASFEQLIDSSEADTTSFESDLVQINSKLREIEKLKPRKKSAESICIKLEMDSTEFPEFNGFKDMLFEIDESDENFSEDLAKIEWDDIKLRKKEKVFELLFFKKFKKTTIRTRPVYQGESYDKALSIYNKENKKKLDSLKNELELRNSSVNQFTNELSSNSDLGFFVTRIFEVNNFGIYNSDYPQRMPKGQLIAIEYLKKSDKEVKDTLKLKKLYLVEENKNILYTLSLTGSLSYNPNNKCVLWGVTTDNKLVVYKSKDFAKIPLNHEGIFNLEFDVIEKDLYAEEKIKEELSINALF